LFINHIVSFQTECNLTLLFTISNPGPSGYYNSLSSIDTEDDMADGGV